MGKVPTIDIDFEIFSEVSIKDVGLDNYLRHKSTEIICMAYSTNKGPTKLWRPGRKHNLPAKYNLVAHNVMFEFMVLSILGPRHGLPMPLSCRCTAAQAAAMTLPRDLSGASKALKLPLLKDTAGKRVMLQVTKPRKPSKTDPRPNWFHKREKMNQVYRYCIQDVDVEMLVDEHTYPIRPEWEREVWEMDSTMNLAGVPVDLDLAHAAVHVAGMYVDHLNVSMRKLTHDVVPNVTAVAKIKEFAQEHGVQLDSIAKDQVILLLGDPGVPEVVKEVLRLRQAGSLTSVAKYKKIINWTSADGRLRHLLMYYGAGTGRWTGKGPQLHNLPRGKYKGDKDLAIRAIKAHDLEGLATMALDDNISPMDIISSCIRETFYSGEDHTFVVGDYAGIEVRVLAWLAGEDQLLQLFRDEKDPYIDMASSIYKVPIGEVTSDQRSVGKMAVLGLGYGMGDEKFVAQCALQGIEISLEFAGKIVQAYRSKYSRIKSLWARLEGAMASTIKSGEGVCGPIQMWLDELDNVVMFLPSGRPLYYIGCKMVPGRFGKFQPSHYKVDAVTRQWIERETYGGMITENATQAIARDILAQGMLRLHRVGSTPILHVHDESILLVPDSQVARVEVQFVNAMLTKEKWSEDIPLKMETWTGKRYKK